MLKEVYLQRLQLLTLLQPYHGGLEVPRKLLQNFRFDFSPLATRTIFTLEMFSKLRYEKAFWTDELAYKLHARGKFVIHNDA